MSAVIAISDNEYHLHKTYGLFRLIHNHLYPVDKSSGKRIKEFVALADACAALGLSVICESDLVEALKAGRDVMKFGPTSILDDIELLKRYPVPGEWNCDNLEKIIDWPDYYQPGREIHSYHLDYHLEQIRALFDSHSKLFIKSKIKGFANVFGSYHAFKSFLGDISRLDDVSKDLWVFESINLKKLPARSGLEYNDEWRHHVYKGELLGSSHAFDDPHRRFNESSATLHIAKAQEVIAAVKGKNFADTYCIDTGINQRDDTVTVIEFNHFFSSGIYDKAIVNRIAAKLAS